MRTHQTTASMIDGLLLRGAPVLPCYRAWVPLAAAGVVIAVCLRPISLTMSAIESMARASGFLPRLRVERVLVNQRRALAEPVAPGVKQFPVVVATICETPLGFGFFLVADPGYDLRRAQVEPWAMAWNACGV